MSQQHIPQPNSQSAAPAEVFDSTAVAPHPSSVSGIGTGDPSSAEGPVHAGQNNTFDITIHRQFIPIDNFIWNTSMKRGHLLWYTPVHPSRCNPLIDHLSKIYNCWDGGLEYNFKVAGTGFHAGALAFVRLPPNRHPTDYKAPSEWGAFEYIVIDPKTLEIMTAEIMDQRRFHYHYMQFDPKDPDSFGGYMACYVLMDLNASSTGTQQITVQAFCRPGPKFRFSQMIPPIMPPNPTPNVFPQAVLDALTPMYGDVAFRTKSGIEQMTTLTEKDAIYPLHVLGLNKKTVYPKDVMQMYIDRGDNIFTSESYNDVWKIPEMHMPACQRVVSIGDIYYFGNQIRGWWGALPLEGVSSAIGLVFKDGGSIKFSFGTGARLSYIETSDSGWISVFSWKPATGQTAPKPSSKCGMVSTETGIWQMLDPIEPPGGLTSINSKVKMMPRKDEVFLVYQGKFGAAGVYTTDIQTEAFVRALLEYDLSVAVPPGNAVLLMMSDSETQVPLGQVKLYRNGIMAMSSKLAGQVFAAPKFTYIGLVPEINPLSVSASEVMNVMALSQNTSRLEKLRLKRLRKLEDSHKESLQSEQI